MAWFKRKEKNLKDSLNELVKVLKKVLKSLASLWVRLVSLDRLP